MRSAAEAGVSQRLEQVNQLLLQGYLIDVVQKEMTSSGIQAARVHTYTVQPYSVSATI